MSIAAEPVAGRQRLRERLRAGTLEMKLAVSGFVAIAVHVLDDNLFSRGQGLRRSTTALAAWYRSPSFP